MDIPSNNNQLIPYYPDQHQVMPQTAGISDAVPVFADRRLMRYNLLGLKDFSGSLTPPDLHEPEYSSDRRLNTPKLNQVGLLIDIYA
jgi:hypothetical protein